MADDLFWFNFVQRCLAIITALPVQAKLVKDVNRMTSYLAGMPDQDRQATIAVAQAIQPGEQKLSTPPDASGPDPIF